MTLINIDRDKISSFALASFICANSISWLQLFSRMLPVIVLVCFIVIIIVRHKDFNLNKRNLRILGVITLVYISFILTLLHSKSEKFNDYFLNFTIIGLTSLIISTIRYDFKLVFKYILLLFVAPLSYLFNIQEIVSQQDDMFGFLMGVSYGILPYTLAAIYFILTKNNKIIIKIYSIVIFVTCMSFFFTFGSRGPQVAILLFFFYLIYLRLKHMKYALQISLFLLLITIYVFLPRGGDTGIYFIDKMVETSQRGDVSNGRYEIYSFAFLEFIKNPIIGNGIGTFSFGGVSSYPHNLILQMLFESGIFYTIALLIPIINFIRRFFNENLDDINKIVTMFLICGGIVGLMFSSIYWITQSFWLILGFGVSYSSKQSLLNNY